MLFYSSNGGLGGHMLTRRDLTRILVKMFGLLVLLRAAVDLPSAIYQFALQMRNWEIARVAYDWPTAVTVGASHLGPVAAYVAIGLVFLWWSGRIVDRVSEAPQDSGLPLALADLKNIELSLVTVIGLYFLADGFAELCRWIFSQGLNYRLAGVPTPAPLWTRLMLWADWREIPWILQALVKLTIGFLLVLGRGGTVAALYQARNWVRKWRAWPYELE
jgi:hypothetical protein